VPLWLTISLPFLGFAAGVVAELVRGFLSLKKDREARRDTLIAAREEECRSFERETLLELQDAMASLMRNIALCIHHTEIEYKQYGTWGRRQLPDEIGGDTSNDLEVHFNKLRVRMLDDALRHRAKEWWEAGAAATVPALRDEEDEIACQRVMDAWGDCINLYQEVSEGVGERLRYLVAHWDDLQGSRDGVQWMRVPLSK